MKQTEHVFILEWGAFYTKLLYGKMDSAGNLIQQDCAMAQSLGVERGLPVDARAAKVLRGLLDELEARLHLKIQTVFCWIKSSALKAYRVDSVKPYSRLLQRSCESLGSSMIAELRDGALPSHQELVEYFDCEDDARYRWIFGMNAQDKQNLENTLQNAGCFLEDVLVFPLNLSTDAASLEGYQVHLGIHDECSRLTVSSGSHLLLYHVTELSLLYLADRVKKEFDTRDLDTLKIVHQALKPLSFEESQELPVHMQRFLIEHSAVVRELLAAEMERMVLIAAQQLEQWDLLSKLNNRIHVYGAGQMLYRHYAPLLHEILPLIPVGLDGKPHGVESAIGIEKHFASLIHLLKPAYHKRLLNREEVQYSSRSFLQKLFHRMKGA